MSQEAIRPPKSRVFRTRSKTGCRTCRTRRIRCDEFPVACKNCTSTGRKCDYDLHRLPVKRNLSLLPRSLLGRLHAWTLTSDERNCFAFFQLQTVPGLAEVFDSPLWERFILQQSSADPAVSHAVIMLGAIHQGAVMNRMRLSGSRPHNSHLNFSLEQSARAFALLNRRHAFNDPQFYQTVLTCCLLFVMGDILQGNYEKAAMHVYHGVKLLNEGLAQGRVLDQFLVDVFKFLQIASALYAPSGSAEPFVTAGNPEWGTQTSPIIIHSIDSVRQALSETLNYGIALIGYTMRSPAAEVRARYEDLWLAKQRITSRYEQLVLAFDQHCRERISPLSPKENRAAEVFRHVVLTQIVGLRLVFSDGLSTNHLTADCATLLSSSLDIMAKMPKRTTFVMEPVVTVGLHMVATQSPDIHMRVQAIEALRAWPHTEGMHNSEICAGIAMEALKAELRRMAENGEGSIVADFPEGRDQFLVDVLESDQNAASWATVRCSQFKIEDVLHQPDSDDDSPSM
ncbi:uncharacterized protein BP01DRAFT_188559 [Aspergillus saccharolyticus JOP 1030-1]|uniref:Zn(2)-C6 fungal-type domain-containing protein n=1 Tax=Aspergillus saccharolyticus JOP 1030-1 TaxID=1450539 RepID=A0A319A054_9EURO|nr:hypothetical protein BP01DRAFT_188559 [Aspergillus saccharolyticus JOP 1030-1]PYH41012.1 hypothetical protein BP01DRAFT_188559 [Aspergillus saccharolyticus JOP 1030-1]